MSDKKAHLIKLNGTVIHEDGTTKKSGYFNFLDIDLDDYSDVSYTPEEAARIRTHLTHLVTGSTAAIPINCGGPKICPFAQNCQPKGDLVYTVNRGPVPIEKLNEEEDKLWIFHQKQKKIRKTKGWSFKKYEREYNGDLINFHNDAGDVVYNCTPDHLCIAKWEDDAFTDMTSVYLMRKGDKWKIGTSFFLKSYRKQEALGVFFRSRGEKADEAWILGVYKTKKEALLMEEYYSIKWGITKSLFIASDSQRRKYNGLYAWITQEELDAFHNKVKPSLNHVSNCLSSIGLSICSPIWKRQELEGGTVSKRLSTKQYFTVRAVNLIPFSGLFSFSKYTDKKGIVNERINVSRSPYNGKVYSLDVPWKKNYITNGYVTHNCPFVKEDKRRKKEDPKAKMITPVSKKCLVEVQLLREWTKLFIYEYQIDEDNFTEFMMVRELAEIELMLWRLNNNISKPEHAELVQETTVGVDREGNPLTRLEVNAFMEAKERLQNRKSKLIKLMVGDRQEKYKRDAALKVKDTGDPSTSAAKLRGHIDRLLIQAKTLDTRIKQSEGKVIDIPEQKPKQEEVEEVITPEDLIDGE